MAIFNSYVSLPEGNSPDLPCQGLAMLAAFSHQDHVSDQRENLGQNPAETSRWAIFSVGGFFHNLPNEELSVIFASII